MVQLEVVLQLSIVFRDRCQASDSHWGSSQDSELTSCDLQHHPRRVYLVEQ